MIPDRRAFSVRDDRYEECPHPGCRRPWHGLPAAYINPFWPACPGSWAYEQGSTDAQSA